MKLQKAIGQSVPLCPGISDVNLFRYRKSIIDLDDQVLHPDARVRTASIPISGPNVTVTNPVSGHYAIGKIMDVGPWVTTDEANG